MSIALELPGPDSERKANQSSPAVGGVQDLGTTGGDGAHDTLLTAAATDSPTMPARIDNLSMLLQAVT